MLLSMYGNLEYTYKMLSLLIIGGYTMYKYMVEKYGGRLYCGNAFFNTLDDCYKFVNDGMCDKAVIINYETKQKITLKIKEV